MLDGSEKMTDLAVPMQLKRTTTGLRGVSTGRRRAIPAAVLALLLSWFAVAPVPAASGSEKPLHTYPALLGIEIQITADGSLQFTDTATGQPLLIGAPPTAAPSRANRPGAGKIFSARAPEGIPKGRRGDPSRADDDGDGRIDEDRLDGRDNDGDGGVDEDFAAISDAMVVVDAGRGTRHAEFYHWAYSHLMPAVFFTLSGESDPAGIFDYRFEAPGGQWEGVEVYSRRHSTAGRPGLDRCKAQVARIPGRSGGQGAGLWAGAMVLDSGTGSIAPAAPQRDRLDLLHGGEVSVVVCLAESWLQLNRLLCESRRVYDGVLDPVTGSRTPWIVPPLCSMCRQAGNPDFSFSLVGEEDLLLDLAVKDGKTGLVDPDLFVLAGTPLGFPVEILWKPEAGDVQRVRWTGMTPALLQDPVKELSDPFGEFSTLLGHEAAGELTLRFLIPEVGRAWFDLSVAGDEPSGSLQLEGRWLDGRPLRALASQTPDPSPAGSPVAAVAPGSIAAPVPVPSWNQDPGSSNLSLAPELLQGWPNPFRDAIQVRFRIPQTVGETFQWDADQTLPSTVEMSAPVSWKTGAPFVTIKIYRINGQELVTLHQDYSSSGETTVQWDGTDAYGRPAASGPYFCKLQMDDWSVTQRIVFLR